MAQAKAKIGRILFKILKNKDKARVFLYDVTIIVHKLENTHLRGNQWCKDAVIDLKWIQDEGNDAHIEFGKAFKQDLDNIKAEYEKKDPGSFLKYLK